MAYVNDFIFSPADALPAVLRKIAPIVIWTDYANKNLSEENKAVMRAVWNTGYNLYVSEPGYNPNIAPQFQVHAMQKGLDFGPPKNGHLTDVLAAFNDIDQSGWAGGLALGIPPAYPHLHIDLWPNIRQPRRERWIETSYHPYSQVIQSTQKQLYDQLMSNEVPLIYNGSVERPGVMLPVTLLLGLGVFLFGRHVYRTTEQAKENIVKFI